MSASYVRLFSKERRHLCRHRVSDYFRRSADIYVGIVCRIIFGGAPTFMSASCVGLFSDVVKFPEI